MKSYVLMALLMIFAGILSVINTGNLEVLGAGILIGLLLLFGVRYIIEKFGGEVD